MFTAFLSILGRLLFTYDTSIASERSNATFICQDTEIELSLKVTWSFQSSSVGSILSENGSLAPGINRDKYKLLKSTTQLQVTDLRVNDTGNYTCCIKGENGETLLSATAALLVKGKFTEMIYFFTYNWNKTRLFSVKTVLFFFYFTKV